MTRETAQPGVCELQSPEGLLDQRTIQALSEDLAELGLSVTVTIKPRPTYRVVLPAVVVFVLQNIALPVLSGVAANAAWDRLLNHLQRIADSAPEKNGIDVRISRRFNGGQLKSEEITLRASGSPPDIGPILERLSRP